MKRLFAPLVTPFTEREEVDKEGFRENLRRYQQTPLDGYLINGSSGEAEMLTAQERLELVRLAVEFGERPVLAGLAATSVHATLSELRPYADLPLHAVLVRTPSYFGRQLDQVRYFHSLADASPHPVIVYQIPQCTGLKLTGEELRRIAQHENIVGIKDSLGDLSLLNEVEWPAHFRYFLGASGLLQPGLAAGADGGILALANVVPELCRELLELSSDPTKRDSARELQRRLIPLNRLLGGSRGFGIAGLKAACEIAGYLGGKPRSPLKSITPSQLSELESTYQAATGPEKRS